MKYSAILIALSIVAGAAAPAFAAPKPPRGPGPGIGWGPGGKPKAVPGPIAGVGLPVLIVAGGYVWMVRRRRAAASGQGKAGQ